MSEHEAKMRQIIAEKLGVSDDKITPQASFVDDLGADSLDQVELIMALEDEFNIEVQEDELKNIRIVQDIIDAVGRKISISPA